MGRDLGGDLVDTFDLEIGCEEPCGECVLSADTGPDDGVGSSPVGMDRLVISTENTHTV